jgi:hypothetical protein
MVLRALLAACIALSALPPAARAASMRVSSIAELEAAIAQAGPGDTLTRASGRYTAGTIAVGRQGAEGQPITITAEVVGGAVIAGGAFRLGPTAAHVVIRGFRFEGAQLTMDLGSHHILITRNHFEVGSAPRAVHVQGLDQEVSYNNFQNSVRVWSGAWTGWATHAVPTLGDWTHVAFVHSDRWTRLYIDGVLVRHKGGGRPGARAGCRARSPSAAPPICPSPSASASDTTV